MRYKEAGVDIKKADRFVEWVKQRLKGIGFFSGFYEIKKKYKQPVLVSSCDGVGTKLKIAQLLGKHDTVGIDLVAMNVNDVLCSGAEPLFILDYFACGKLNLNVAKEVMKGILEGCKIAGCKLLGGETAEMPNFYDEDEYELAGFCVGLIEKNEIIDGRNIRCGDLIYGLPSSGLHSNGFSLVRKIFSKDELKRLGHILLEPTRIYVKDIAKLKKILNEDLHAIVHITGGGFYGNIVRVLPRGLDAVIHKNKWEIPEIFKLIQKKGNISEKEMYTVFNMGIGMVVIVDKGCVDKMPDGFLRIGEIVRGKRSVRIVHD